jgi:O-acetyl-ADP-ribose deacetylase (regulator of RNase III)
MITSKAAESFFESDAHVLVNTVNCVGVMGRGIALEFKKRYPEMYREYRIRCFEKNVRIGEPYIYKVSDEKWILNFPTKDHWKDPSRLEWIDAGMLYLVAHAREWGIRSIAIPALGCSNGGLNWKRDVLPLLVTRASALGVPVELYAPMKQQR